MPDRFFLARPPADDLAQLEGPDAHHLAHVLRARAGQVVTLFDGSGQEYDAQIESLDRRTVRCRVVDRRAADRESHWRLTLAVSLPKGDRQRWLIEKATELGVAQLVPLITERGVAQPTDSALERLRRAVIEASKQCGRNVLLEVLPPATLEQLTAGSSLADLRLFAHFDQPTSLAAAMQPFQDTVETDHRARADRKPTCFAAIGPEGGFSNQEAQKLATAGWRGVSLGPRTLRVETACLAIAACIASGD